MARKTGHSTAAQAAKAALKAGAGKLLIGHFSSRYPDVEVLVNEARNIFPATEAVVEGESYDIRPGPSCTARRNKRRKTRPSKTSVFYTPSTSDR